MRTTVEIRTAGIPQTVIVAGADQETNVAYVKFQCKHNIGGEVVSFWETDEWDLKRLAKEPKIRKTASFPSWYEMHVPRGWDKETGLSSPTA